MRIGIITPYDSANCGAFCRHMPVRFFLKIKATRFFL